MFKIACRKNVNSHNYLLVYVCTSFTLYVNRICWLCFVNFVKLARFIIDPLIIEAFVVQKAMTIFFNYSEKALGIDNKVSKPY